MNNDTQEYSEIRSLWLKTAPDDREYKVEHSKDHLGRYVTRFSTPFRIATVTDGRHEVGGLCVNHKHGVEVHAIGVEERYEGERPVNLLHHPEILFDAFDDAIVFARMWIQSSWGVREHHAEVVA